MGFNRTLKIWIILVILLAIFTTTLFIIHSGELKLESLRPNFQFDDVTFIKSRFFSFRFLMAFNRSNIVDNITDEERQNLTEIFLHNFKRSMKERFEKLVLNWTEQYQGSIPIAKTPRIISNCSPQQNIVFLKTHKTGSSTITSILNRFAEIHKLSMLLPRKPKYRFNWPASFGGVANIFRRKKANILANHARFNKTGMSLYLKNGTKYISLLRDPVKQFISVFYYQNFDTYLENQFGLNKNNTNNLTALEQFFQNPMYYYKRALNVHRPLEYLPLLRNSMTFDLGFNTHLPRHITQAGIRTMVRKIENDFDLVLITEYFDEGLVLLMNEFCWTFDDILYLKHNSQARNPIKIISPILRKQIIEWNNADFEVYQYFNRTFWRKVENYGASFWKDLKVFRRMKIELYDECSVKEYNETAIDVNVPVVKYKMGDKVIRYHGPFCKKLFYSEVEYVKRFRKLNDLKFKIARYKIINESRKTRKRY